MFEKIYPVLSHLALILMKLIPHILKSKVHIKITHNAIYVIYVRLLKTLSTWDLFCHKIGKIFNFHDLKFLSKNINTNCILSVQKFKCKKYRKCKFLRTEMFICKVAPVAPQQTHQIVELEHLPFLLHVVCFVPPFVLLAHYL